MNQNQNLDSSSSFNVRIQERQRWPSSSDSISRVDLDSIRHSQNQQKPSNITPSQEKVTEAEKVRSRYGKNRRKAYKYNRPKLN